MFKRVIYHIWTASFGVPALAPLTFTIRAMTLRKDRADQMARMPLDD